MLRRKAQPNRIAKQVVVRLKSPLPKTSAPKLVPEEMRPVLDADWDKDKTATRTMLKKTCWEVEQWITVDEHDTVTCETMGRGGQMFRLFNR